MYHLKDILTALGHSESGIKNTLTRRKRYYGISIEDPTKVSREVVITILNTLYDQGIASVMERLEEFSTSSTSKKKRLVELSIPKKIKS